MPAVAHDERALLGDLGAGVLAVGGRGELGEREEHVWG
jgi:hypothetical protein